MITLKWISLAGVLLSMASCGGSSSSSPATAEGFWTGTSTTGTTVSVAVLEDGEVWGVYSTTNTIIGAIVGTSAVNGNSISGTGTDFDIPTRTSTPGTFSGTFSTQSSLNVTTSKGVTFTAAYDPTYGTPASLAAAAGTFVGGGVSETTSNQVVTVTLNSSGFVSATAGNGCTASGLATPRPSGKNVLNVTMTFSGITCGLGNGTVTTGIAYYDVNIRNILVLALNPGKTDGFIYLGSKT